MLNQNNNIAQNKNDNPRIRDVNSNMDNSINNNDNMNDVNDNK